MNNKIAIETKQSSRQTLSKRMLAEINLLQYSTIDLQQRIRQEIEQNPAFEVDDITAKPEEGEEEINNENSEEINPDDYEESDDYIEPRYDARNHSADEDYTQVQIKDETDVTDLLKSQIDFKEISERQRTICKYLIDCMDNRGFIERDPYDIVDDYAMTMGEMVNEQEIEEALATIKTLEPVGIGAKDLRECFLLQINAMPEEKKDNSLLILQDIIENHFKKLSEQNLDGILSVCRISPEQLQAALGILKKLNPSPLGSYGEAALSIRGTVTPDFLIDVTDGEIILSLNKADMPELTISEWFRDMAEGKGTNDKEAIRYSKNCIEEAEWFIGALARRDQTMLSVMQAIIKLQRTYFLTGDETKLRPMQLLDVKEITGLDVGTISKITSNNFMQCPYGIIPLKRLFTDAANTSNGEDVSTLKVKAILAETIEAEDKSNPLSDQALSEIMTKKGYTLARRTISKYREQLNIPSAQARKILKVLILLMMLPLMMMAQNFGNAQLGYIVYDLDSDKTVASKDPDIKMTPASVMKIFTTATTLELFGGSYEFCTNVLTDGTISKGTLKGNLYIHGAADPTIESKVYPDDHFFSEMAKGLKAKGIEKIEGNIIADGAVLFGEAVGNRWVVEDLYTYYGVGCFGISLFDNVQTLTIRGVDPPLFTPKYPESKVTVTSNLQLTDGGSSAIMVYTVPYCNNYVVEGALHRGNYASPQVAIPNPIILMANYTRSQLRKAGIEVTGEAMESKHNPPHSATLLYTYKSPLMGNIVREVNFNSNNHYAQHLFRLLGTRCRASGSTTHESLQVFTDFWKSKGIRSLDHIAMYDGNGLSPMNAVSPRMVIDVLKYMRKSESAYYFMQSLPRCGQQGTVKGLFWNMPEVEAYAKSGSMTGVQSYAGYIRYHNRNYAFCVMVNEFDDERSVVKRNIQDLLLNAIKR